MVLIIIVAVPFFLAVTTPPDVTVAILVSELRHVIFLFVALDGIIVAFKVTVFPFSISTFVLFNFIPVTDVFTVTLHVAVLPLFVFTVIFAVPLLFAVTTPPDVTVATLVFELDHVTFLLLAFDGVIVAFKVTFLPFSISTSVLFNFIPVAKITSSFGINGFSSSIVSTIITLVDVL